MKTLCEYPKTSNKLCFACFFSFSLQTLSTEPNTKFSKKKKWMMIRTGWWEGEEDGYGLKQKMMILNEQNTVVVSIVSIMMMSLGTNFKWIFFSKKKISKKNFHFFNTQKHHICSFRMFTFFFARISCSYIFCFVCV